MHLRIEAKGTTDVGIADTTRGRGSSLDQGYSSLFDVYFWDLYIMVLDQVYDFWNYMTFMMSDLL